MSAILGEQLPDLSLTAAEPEPLPARALPGAVLRIPVSVQIVIGSARLALAEVAELAPGSTITLDEKLGAPARVLVNGREVAKGELFVLDGESGRLGLTITDVAGPGPAMA